MVRPRRTIRSDERSRASTVNQPTDPPGHGKIGVVIVAYNSSLTLANCLRGVLDDPAVTHVVVVDNARDPDTHRVVAASNLDGRISYIAPTANMGFAGGCNIGARALTDVEFIFLVNPDVALQRRLSELVKTSDANFSVLGAHLDSGPGSLNARRRVTRMRELAKAALGSRVYSAAYRKQLTSSQPRPLKVDQVDGALLGARYSSWKLMGGLDEQFELYYEDVDYCIRSLAIGPILFSPVTWGTHIGGASSGRTSRNAYVVSRVSRIRYLRKHFGGGLVTAAFCVLISLVEFAARSIGNKSEGLKIRTEGLVAQWRELLRPHSIHVLRTSG